jgi:hypothetical protein
MHCEKKGRLLDAIAHYHRALAIRPKFAEAHNNARHCNALT